MSRGSRDDVRAEPTRDDPNRARIGLRSGPDPYMLGRHLKPPRTEVREPIQAGGKVYHLRGSESRALATVGAFRVIPANDLEEQRTARMTGTETCSGSPTRDSLSGPGCRSAAGQRPSSS